MPTHYITVEFAGYQYSRPEKLYQGFRMRFRTLILSAFIDKHGEMGSEDEWLDWVKSNMYNPDELYYPTLDLFFKPIGVSPALSELCEYEEFTKAEAEMLDNAINFILANVFGSTPKPFASERSTNDILDIPKVESELQV